MKEDNCLKLQIGVFMVLPVLYLIYLKMTSMYAGMALTEFFAQNSLEGLNILRSFSGVYSGYAIYQYRKDMIHKENFIAYLIVGVAQIFMMNTIGIVMMLYTICYFTGISRIKQNLIQYPWKGSYKALAAAIFVLAISLVFLAIRVKTII